MTSIIRGFRQRGSMPYSKTHYYMLALLVITVLAFWPSYFGRLSDAPLAHHLHGVTGTLWILLIAVQSYVIHARKIQLHRRVGKLVFVLAPVLIGSFALVTWVGSQKAIAGHPFYVRFGQALLTADAILTVATAALVYLALRFRAKVHLHSALMISTVCGLLPPILSRLITNSVPGLRIDGPDTIYRFGYGLHISMVLTIGIGVFLYFRYRANGWPWLLGAGITAFVYLMYATYGQTEAWAAVVQQMSSLSPGVIFGFGLLLGILACVLGWRHGKRGRG